MKQWLDVGLGTQIRPQIEKRFGAQFDRPVQRMTEFVAALRAISTSWRCAMDSWATVVLGPKSAPRRSSVPAQAAAMLVAEMRGVPLAGIEAELDLIGLRRP